MKKNLTVGLILIIAFSVILILVGHYFPQKKLIVDVPEEIIEEMPQVALPKVLYNLSGTIQKIELDFFIFEAKVPMLDEAGQLIQKEETRKVLIAPTTKFITLTFVEVEPGRKRPEEKEIFLEDLKIGDYVEVISNRDIYKAEEFGATKIRLISM
jgi:hypothetical protein